MIYERLKQRKEVNLYIYQKQLKDTEVVKKQRFKYRRNLKEYKEC